MRSPLKDILLPSEVVTFVEVDNCIDAESENPVANKTIYTALHNRYAKNETSSDVQLDAMFNTKQDKVLQEPDLPFPIVGEHVTAVQATYSGFNLSTNASAENQTPKLSFPVLTADAVIATTADIIDTTDLVTKSSGGSISADVEIFQRDLNILSGRFSGGENSFALGKNTFAYGNSISAIGDDCYVTGISSIAGCYGWYYDHIDFANNTFYLTKNQPQVTHTSSLTGAGTIDTTFNSGFEVGDVISYVNKAKFDLALSVVGVNGNQISVSPFKNTSSYKIDESTPNTDDWTIFCPRKPLAGGIWLGEAANAQGLCCIAANAYSHAEGMKNLAYGQYSHVEGYKNQAAYAAHAEGKGNYADGQYSHAEGWNTRTQKDCAHAEGNETSAYNECAHAEGHKTLASGLYSHAEGNQTSAVGTDSRAFGNQTYASGYCSFAGGDAVSATNSEAFAIGWKTSASGQYSFAGGQNTKSTANQSFVFGNSSEANGGSSFASGWKCVADKDNTYAFGLSAIADHKESFVWNAKSNERYVSKGQGTFNINPKNGADGVFVGTQSLADLIAAGGSAELANYLDKRTGGEVSGDVGIIQHNLNILSGDYIQTNNISDIDIYSSSNGFIQAVSCKYGRPSIGTNGFYVLSVISPNKLKISGDIDIPIDAQNSLWSVALSNSLNAQFGKIIDISEQILTFDSNFSGNILCCENMIEAQLTALIANDDNAFYCPTHPEVGNASFITFNCQHAEGGGIHAIAQYAHAEGRATIAEGRYSHAEGGNGTTAGGVASHAEGFGTKALGNRAHSEGSETKATYWAAHAEGTKSEATGNSSHAEGYFSHANGAGSHAEGGEAERNLRGGTANGSGSHAEGYSTYAESHWSHAEGAETYAMTEIATHAEGFATKATGKASHSEGRRTLAGTGTKVASDSETTDGYFSHAEGNGTWAKGNSSHAEGKDAQALGLASHAEGLNTQALGNYTHAEGQNTSTKADKVASHAEGFYTQALGSCSHAEGCYSKAEGNGSHAEGGGASSSLPGGYAKGLGSHAEGYNTLAEGNWSHAEGSGCQALGVASHASGQKAIAKNDRQFVWNGVDTNYDPSTSYSAGAGTFCINPTNNLRGFYIGTDDFISCIVKAVQIIASDSTKKAALKTALQTVLA